MTLVTYVGALQSTGAIVCFRFLPIVGAFVASRGPSAIQKVFCFAAFAAASLASWDVSRALVTVFAYVYFMLASCLVPDLTALFRDRQWNSAALLVLYLALYFLTPAIFFPQNIGRDIALFLGWEFALAAYSYSVEKCKVPGELSTRECVFFVVVNPVLVFPHRGSESPVAVKDGAFRVMSGSMLVALDISVVQPTCIYVQGTQSAGSSTWARVVAAVVLTLLIVVGQYSRQAGVAGIQLGAMATLGWRIPERFLKPWKAKSPMDFWRRWNTYLGEWIRRYLFFPLSMQIHRRRIVSPAAGQAIALLVSFAFVGLLHDMVSTASAGALRYWSTIVFLAAGLQVVVWGAARRRYPRNLAPGSGSLIQGSLASFYVSSVALFYVWSLAYHG